MIKNIIYIVPILFFQYWNLLQLICQNRILKILLYKNAQDICGDTALSLALLYNHFEVTNILVSAGADVNIANKNGITPLSYAIRYNLEKIKCVIKEKIVEKIENATNIKDRIALEDQLRQL